MSVLVHMINSGSAKTAVFASLEVAYIYTSHGQVLCNNVVIFAQNLTVSGINEMLREYLMRSMVILILGIMVPSGIKQFSPDGASP